MTEDQLKELEDLLAKATPGEWEREGRDEEDWIAGRRQNAEMGNIVCSQPEMSLSAKRWEANAALIVAMHRALPSLLSTARQAEVMRGALDWYARAGGAAFSIEAAERGDLDLSDASIALTEDCGDKAREALASTGEKVS
jgi:hypothetical protein